MSTYLVTGAGRGIGLEFIRQLRGRGDTVVATVRDVERAGALRELGARVEALAVDDPASIAALGERLAGVPIDVLINNAGIRDTGDGLAELRAETLQHVFAVNAVGPMLVVQALLSSLRAGSGRRIAHITSTLGSIGDNTSGGAYAYRASKAALNMLNKSLAVELDREGFVCVVLSPGWARTDMGGADAPLSVETSVRGLLAVVDGLAPGSSGRFYNHDGRELRW
jgi:NAD(P)-dependent dehydrogenase (short-subunit alcohol dehydrogenase family)